MNKERLYIVITGDSVSVYHRPSFTYITSCTLKETKALLKTLLSMNTLDFYKYLYREYNIRIVENKCLTSLEQDREKWFQEAWKSMTENFLKCHKLAMKYEEPVYLSISELEDKPKKRLKHKRILRKLRKGR